MTEGAALAGVRRVAPAARQDFTTVFAEHHAGALRLAYLLTGDPDRADDVVAEAMAKVWRAWERGRVEHPRAYIRRAVVNVANSGFRRLRLERREAEKRSGDARGGRSHDEQTADADLILTALRRLPERQRTAVVLRYYADLSEAETAAAMSCSVGTVKSSVSRGLGRLRQLVDREVA